MNITCKILCFTLKYVYYNYFFNIREKKKKMVIRITSIFVHGTKFVNQKV